ncbi:hypothetical protein [Streptobacillus canis]|uniref:hypothetical protein n=1 Tax=Streptobacillus canis TaxID=2678686 RepID=UPI0012E266AF|nr:hypothetical protein [Streptobacillus canis]
MTFDELYIKLEKYILEEKDFSRLIKKGMIKKEEVDWLLLFSSYEYLNDKALPIIEDILGKESLNSPIGNVEFKDNRLYIYTIGEKLKKEIIEKKLKNKNEDKTKINNDNEKKVEKNISKKNFLEILLNLDKKKYSIIKDQKMIVNGNHKNLSKYQIVERVEIEKAISLIIDQLYEHVNGMKERKKDEEDFFNSLFGEVLED